MEDNYNLLTTDELKEKLRTVEERYNNAQKQITINYNIMADNAKIYEQIKAIINRREGKSDGEYN